MDRKTEVEIIDGEMPKPKFVRLKDGRLMET
jgi:hypothetical protein